MNILDWSREKEVVAFTSMATIECLPYIKHDEVIMKEVSEMNSLTREEKPTEENLEVPVCRTTRH